VRKRNQRPGIYQSNRPKKILDYIYAGADINTAWGAGNTWQDLGITAQNFTVESSESWVFLGFISTFAQLSQSTEMSFAMLVDAVRYILGGETSNSHGVICGGSQGLWLSPGTLVPGTHTIKPQGYTQSIGGTYYLAASSAPIVNGFRMLGLELQA